MKHYNLMVLRSYLDTPDKYIQPTSRHEYKQMDMLKPNICRLELHEYPKEHVLVLEGENLWFSFEVTLDEGGENEYQIKDPHNVTKQTLQFNFPPSSKVSRAIQNGGKVKVTLNTHFVKKVLETVQCKKVIYRI